MLKLKVLVLAPKFALAFAGDITWSSRVVGGPGNQLNFVLPPKPSTASIWERSAPDRGIFYWLHRRESFKKSPPIPLRSTNPEGEEND